MIVREFVGRNGLDLIDDQLLHCPIVKIIDRYVFWGSGIQFLATQAI
jgi:hypothetical protein